MKTKIVAIVFGLFLIGVVNASLVGFLSNIITGSVEVQGPVFYLDNTNTGLDAGSMYLKLNNPNVIGEDFNLSSNKFYSDSLGVDHFYPMDFKIILNAIVSGLPKNETTNETLETCSVDVTVYQVSNSGSYRKTLCEVVKGGFDNEGDYEEYEFICTGSSESEISFHETDRIELLLVEQCPSGSLANIKLSGQSYIQIVPKS